MNNNKEDFKKALRDNAAGILFHRLLGLNSDCFDTENGCIHFNMKDEFIGNRHFKILHGGVIASVLDIEGAFLLSLNGAWRSEMGSPSNPGILIKGGTIDLRVDYLRPGKGKRYIVSGTILRRGSKVAVVHSELRNELDELVATGTGTYLVG
jgi:acyl-coenzyme A thioesterase PaaI-like protein